MKPSEKPLVLIVGATGYIGGLLLKSLERQQSNVRCLARVPDYLKSRVASATEVVAGDVLKSDTLPVALSGVHTAYYLMHSMGNTKDFEQQDRLAAHNFAHAAKQAGVHRIIYLGGLGDPGSDLSPHLKSRHEVGQILQESESQVIEFRASIVIGCGSLSFEMIRALVERLPVMITPRWVSVAAQPVSSDDVIAYLLKAFEIQISSNKIFEIGGADIVSYGDIMREYARQRGLKRMMIPVPFLTPWLSSLWLGLVTPLYARTGRKLIDSIRNPTIVQDNSATTIFDVHPVGIEKAIAKALKNENEEIADSCWFNSLSSAGKKEYFGGIRFRNRMMDTFRQDTNASKENVFSCIQRIGGTTGWYYANWIWKIRGLIDLAVGGVGMRRGRRDPNYLKVGDVVDCWRVEEIIPPRYLRLAIEMKLPGRSWLEFEVLEHNPSSSIRLTLMYDPVGLSGILLWYAMYPAHYLVFKGMLKEMAKVSENINGGIQP